LGDPPPDILRSAVQRVFARVDLVPEPVAAASFFAANAGADVPPDGWVVVYDLGAGTFDVAVVRRSADGFVVLAADGLLDAGRLDIDAAIMAHLGATVGGRKPSRWRRLIQPESRS
jgi:molecular chaperone DnaK (HSP70)